MKLLFTHPIVFIKRLINRSGELTGNKHRSVEVWIIIIRNILVLCAAILFVLGMFRFSHRFLLKALGYIFGAGAYFCEILILSDLFSKKIPFREKFMAYCFGGLYVLMAISYFAEHFEH